MAALRMESGRTPHDPYLHALVAELTERDPDFRNWWASHRVRGPRQLAKTYHHPVAGTVVLNVQQFTVDTVPDQHLVAFTAEPGSASQEALRFLLQWTSTPAGDRNGHLA